MKIIHVLKANCVTKASKKCIQLYDNEYQDDVTKNASRND